MMDYFDTTLTHNDAAALGADLTWSDIATFIVPVLIGMTVVGIISVLMLL